MEPIISPAMILNIIRKELEMIERNAAFCFFIDYLPCKVGIGFKIILKGHRRYKNIALKNTIIVCAGY
jgi:hypothetical protein